MESRSGLGEVVANVGDRIQEIIDTAERIAGEIRADAEAAGDAYLEERRREADRLVEAGVREFTDVTNSLAVRVEALQREASALVEALEEARGSLVGFAPGFERPPDLHAAGEERVPEQDERVPEQAILRATQMAVAGVERPEIESMLRREFEIQDPAALVDRLLHSEQA
jgi:hypothetical protein